MMLRQLLIVGTPVALLSLSVLAGATPVGSNVQVTDVGLGPYGDADHPALTLQNNRIYAAWLDTRTGSTTQRPIYFARSDDRGETWSANRQVSLSDYVGFTGTPVINTAPDGSIWIAWWLNKCFSIEDACGGEDLVNDTRLALSTDGGETFEEYQAFDGTDSGLEIDGFPQIYAENNRTLLLTYNPVGDGVDIMLRSFQRREPGNLAFTTVQVSEGSGNGRIADSGIPKGPLMSMAVRDETVCVAWEDRRARFAIFGACSTDRGVSFGSNFQISGNDSFKPRLALAPDGTLYAAYQAVEGGPILLRRSRDNGTTWDTPNQAFALQDGLTIPDYDLAMSSSGQVVLTMPLSSGSGWGSSSDLFLATSLDQGQRFTLNGPLEDGQGRTPAVASQLGPRTVVGTGPDGTHAVVIWADDRNTQKQIWSVRVDLDSTPPTAPSNLVAESGDTSILLRWEAATDSSGISGYHVLRATREDGPFTQLTPRLVTTTSYRDIGLDTTRYFYRVYAVDGTGNPGSPSNVVAGSATVGSGLSSLNGTIAYEVGQNIAIRDFVGDDLGDQRTLESASIPVFSRDGQLILSITSNDTKSSLIGHRLDGSERRMLYEADTIVSDLNVTDNSGVLALTLRRSFVVSFFCLVFEPQLVDIQGAEQRFRADNIIATDMAISSDGTWMAYTYGAWCGSVARGVYDPERLCVVNTTIDTEERYCLEGVGAEGSDFVPGREQLVFSADFTGQYELWRADVAADGTLTNFVQLTRGPAGQPALAPRVSTDGTWVIFERDLDPGEDEQRVLHVVCLDGDGLRSLGIEGRRPAWWGGGREATDDRQDYRVLLPILMR